MRLALKVVPSSSRDEVVGFLGAALKVRVRAPAERGRANRAVVALLAKTFRVEQSKVRIVSGAGSPVKVAEIEGLESDALERLRTP